MKTAQQLTTLQLSYVFKRYFKLDIANRQLVLSKNEHFSSSEIFDLNQISWIDTTLSANFKQGYQNMMTQAGTWFQTEKEFSSVSNFEYPIAISL